ncbi:VOC family protein [Vibrio sp. DW001]|uniref:VOC family protein n=1 Tax=Vibrio sp. DW001 TaxID=2912315 RepID=UPI0023B1A0DD|nr:VOC family protein [Vibrio sp. DW001]WED29669.1 VOC family protein [Vibrio sp. DW001]
MEQSINHIALVVENYDDTIDLLKLELSADTYQMEQNKRWIIDSTTAHDSVTLLLVHESDFGLYEAIGHQFGGRAFLFSNADLSCRDNNRMVNEGKGVEFIRFFEVVDYGMIVVFEDFYGNLWNLLERNEEHIILVKMAQLKST